jgi:CelD/BcsL family acetyltransferase involved in cellulose biosynthesis
MRPVAPHFFASDEFLQTVADVYFPGARPETVECEGFHTRTLIHRGKPVTGFWWFPFPHHRLDAEPAARRVPRLEHAVLSCERLSGAILPEDGEIAPLVRWDGFASWGEYLAFARSRGARTTSLARDEARLTRSIGKVQFVAEDTDPELLPLTLGWKAAHYTRTGMHRLATAQDREMYRQMSERGLLRASSLRAGGRIVASALWHLRDGVFIFRLTTYDRALAGYSPGAMLTDHLLRHRYESGDREFDMLAGREGYKYQYATHARYLGTIGSEPTLDRWRRRTRMHAGRFLMRHPGMQDRARALEAHAKRVAARWGL